jgi:hypothetical protein
MVDALLANADGPGSYGATTEAQLEVSASTFENLRSVRTHVVIGALTVKVAPNRGSSVAAKVRPALVGSGGRKTNVPHRRHVTLHEDEAIEQASRRADRIISHRSRQALLQTFRRVVRSVDCR